MGTEESASRTSTSREEGGGGYRQGASNPMAKDCGTLRKNAENCGGVTEPPEASKSDTSAQGTHGAPTSARGGRAESSCGKLRKIADLNAPPPPCSGKGEANGTVAQQYAPQPGEGGEGG